MPIRTVLFTGLAKFDGTRQRILRTREFKQIAGRAGRAGFDTIGYVVVQAPEHVIENERRIKKAGDDPKKLKKVQRTKPPEGTIVWTEQTFDKLVHGDPEALVSRMKVDNSMLLNVVARETDAFEVMKRLLRDNHEDPRNQTRLIRRALRLTRSLLRLRGADPAGRARRARPPLRPHRRPATGLRAQPAARALRPRRPRPARPGERRAHPRHRLGRRVGARVPAPDPVGAAERRPRARRSRR